jgi:hypothetical protein
MLVLGGCPFQFYQSKNKLYLSVMINLDVLELTEDFQIVKKFDKSIYNTDKQTSLNEWVKIAPRQKQDFPNFKSAFNIGGKGRMFDSDSFGYLVTNGNSVEKNISNCYLISGPPNNNKSGTNIYEENFTKVVSTISSSSLILADWTNSKDEYLKPNEKHVQYENFESDSIVITLFGNSFGLVSFRNLEYKEKLWDIKNEFFWMSVDKMKELSDEKGYDELYNDARTSPDRYVYKLLFGEERIYDKLSPDAKAVLDKATELVEKSMELRQVMANDENHLNSWDAGYAQLKLVWKEYFQEDFKEFRQLYKELENRMRPLVYELGFLLK